MDDYELDEEENFEEAKALAVIESKLSATSSAVSSAKIITPVESVEKSLAQFARDSFEIVRNDYDFHQKIQGEVTKRLDKFTENQLIALLSNDSVNLNDRVSKVMAPTFGLITSKQQSEIAARSTQDKAEGRISGGVKQINESMDADLLNGIKAFNDMLNVLQSAASKQKDSKAIEDEAGPDTLDVTE
jgi:hypothetical protein